MKTLLNWFAIIILFGGSIAVIATRYEAERTVEVQRGIGIVPTMLVGLILAVFISFLVNNFKGKIYNDPFGKFAVTVYAIAFLALYGFVWFSIRTVTLAAESSVATFVDNMQYHMQTALYLILVVVAALMVAWIHWIYDLIKK